MFKTIIEAILEHEKSQPGKIALVAEDGEITYEELAAGARRISAFLKGSGCRPGDRVMLSAVSCRNYFFCYYGIHMAGCIVAPIDPNAKNGQIKDIYEDLEAALFINDKHLDIEGIKERSLKDIGEGQEEVCLGYGLPDEDALCDVLYTTGTTGRAKGVKVTHRNQVTVARNLIGVTAMEAEDVVMTPLPLNHSNALGTMGAYLYNGSTYVAHNGFLNIKAMCDKIEKYHCTAFSGAPSGLKILDKATRGHIEDILGKVRYVEIGTAPMDMAQKKSLMGALPDTRLLMNYGATEARRAVYMDLNEHPERLTSIGKPLDGVSIKILDEENQEIESSPSRVGRIAICGGNCMAGYWRAPDLTEETMVAGGILTNDLGYIDEEGFIFLMGRANDMINIGGEKVSPFEIEDAILSFGGISECACIAIEDKNGILGEAPMAFIVPSEGEISTEELRDYLLKRLEGYKVPATYEAIKELPKNYMGKIDRQRLKKIADGGIS